MKFPWRKKKSEIIEEDKILFITSELNNIENFPIVEAKNWKWEWARKSREEYLQHLKDGAEKIPAYSHVSRCPGIIDICKEGYIVQTNREIILDPGEEGFAYIVSDSPRFQEGAHGVFKGVNYEAIQKKEIHTISNLPLQVTELISKPDWCYPWLFKYIPGWQAITPPDIKLLVIPIPYPDDWTVVHSFGVLDPSISTQINCQAWIKKAKDGEQIHIKPGTPLMQIIPLTNRKLNFDQRYAHDADQLWEHKLRHVQAGTFLQTINARKLTAKMYKLFWHEGKKIP